MIFDGRWKYVHVEHFRPLLFDLQNDPNELADLGNDPAFFPEIERLKEMHFSWTRMHHNRITKSAQMVEKMTEPNKFPGVLIGYWDKEELEAHGRSLPENAEG